MQGQYDRVPGLVADLAQRRVAVIAAPGFATGALAAKAATTTIPIVFGVGDDPVKLGLVASLARPDGNVTGINFFVHEIVSKRLGLLREIVPNAARIAVLVNPGSAEAAEATFKEAREVAPALGVQILPFNARTAGEIDAAFIAMARERADALLVGGDSFLFSRLGQFAHADGARPAADDFLRSRVCPSRRADELRGQRQRHVPPSWGLCRDHRQRRQARRPPSLAVGQIRVSHQPPNGPGAGPRSAAHAARPRRRGDRVNEAQREGPR